jgi:nicotinamide-nucleotide amidase
MSKLIEYLLKRNLKIGFAESITGGALSYNFVKNEGASKYFKGSIICYSNSIKTDVLSVSKETIEKHGVVSNKVSEELAFGIKKILNLDVAISVTGNVEKNGIVFFSVLFNEKVFTNKILMPYINRKKNINHIVDEITEKSTSILYNCFT